MSADHEQAERIVQQLRTNPNAYGWTEDERILARAYLDFAARLDEAQRENERLREALARSVDDWRDARDGLDLGLGFARDHAQDHAVHPKDRWTRLLNAHLERARSAQRKVEAALGSDDAANPSGALLGRVRDAASPRKPS